MSTFWIIVLFCYALGGVKGMWIGFWRAAFNTKTVSTFDNLDLGIKVLLVVFAFIVEFLIYFGMAHLLVWWIGAQ